MKNRIRVVWLCHFSNSHIQRKISAFKEIPEFAPWISIGINESKKRDDIELHIVSPHRWIGKQKTFEEDGIHYYFFNPGVPFLGRQWPSFLRLDLWTNYSLNRKRIISIIKKISPDIIHLHGLENAYYSSAVFNLKDMYPVLSTIQGFISKTSIQGELAPEVKSRIKTEKRLLKELKKFGVRTSEMEDEVRKYNQKGKLYWHEYFLNTPDQNINNSKSSSLEYDLIFFCENY